MGSAYDFNLLMYFLALRIGTRCLPGYHGSQYVSNSLCPLKFVTAALFSLRPFVSPQSPFRPLSSSVLLLPAAAAWLGFLFCSCSTAESS